MNLSSFFVKAAAAAAFALVPAAAAAQDWKFSSSFNYDTGRYGTGERTDSVYIPFTLKRYYGYADISVTVPYLRQSSSGRITRVGGSPARTSGNAAAPADRGAASGPGDVLFRGSYYLWKEAPGSFDLSLAGSLKLPTANDRKGLGTGEIDQGAGLEFAKKISQNWTLLADGYYTIIGDPPGADYDNQILLDIGFYRTVGAGLSLTVLYGTRSALVAGNADPRELSCVLDHRPAGGTHYFAGLLLGLSRGSPDLGLSAGLGRQF